LKTDFGGLPIAFHLTGGEASDSRNFETLLDIGPDLNPRAAWNAVSWHDLGAFHESLDRQIDALDLRP
jgi:hypothetical protein